MYVDLNKNKADGLLDRVVLIINGLSESGSVLAKLLAQEGADVAMIDFHDKPILIERIQQDVENCGRRCIILTPDSQQTDLKTFSQQALRTITEAWGKVDSFVTYSPFDSHVDLDELPDHENGRSRPLTIFDDHDLTKITLKQILAQ